MYMKKHLRYNIKFKKAEHGTSLVVQWLRLHTHNAGGLGPIPGQGTRSCMLQLRAHMPQLKDPERGDEDLACHN